LAEPLPAQYADLVATAAASATAVTAATAAATATAAAVTAAATTCAAAKAAATAAATATATVTAATTCAAAEATATGRTWLHGPRFIDHEATTAELLTIHFIDGGLRFSVASHFYKAKTLGATRVAFHHDFCTGDVAVCCECLLQILITE
jgi:hypothetical protein